MAFRWRRVINAGRIPQHNAVLNQVYANVLNKPILVPDGVPTKSRLGDICFAGGGGFLQRGRGTGEDVSEK